MRASHDYGMIDGGGAAELLLDGTPGRLVLADGRAALADALDAGALALCAEAVGAAMEVRDDAGLPRTAQAVRPADRQLPGAAAPRWWTC